MINRADYNLKSLVYYNFTPLLLVSKMYTSIPLVKFTTNKRYQSMTYPDKYLKSKINMVKFVPLWNSPLSHIVFSPPTNQTSSQFAPLFELSTTDDKDKITKNLTRAWHQDPDVP